MPKNRDVNKTLAPAANDKATAIHPLRIQTVQIAIVSTTPFLMNRFTEIALATIEAKATGAAKAPKRFTEPKEEFHLSAHLMPGSTWEDKKPRFGFPAIAFKKAIVKAANDAGFKQVEVNRWFHISGNEAGLVEMFPTKVTMDSRPVKGPAIKNRCMLEAWRAVLNFRFNASCTSAEQLAQFIDFAGFGVGVGSFRFAGGGGGVGMFGGFETEKKRRAAG